MKKIALIGNRIEVKIFRSYVRSTSDELKLIHVEQPYELSGSHWCGYIDLGGYNNEKTKVLIEIIKSRTV